MSLNGEEGQIFNRPFILSHYYKMPPLYRNRFGLKSPLRIFSEVF